MFKRIGLTVAAVLAAGAVGFTGSAGAEFGVVAKPVAQCPGACPHVYAPVTCKFSDGSVRTFSNRCFAGVFACQKGLKIIRCSGTV